MKEDKREILFGNYNFSDKLKQLLSRLKRNSKKTVTPITLKNYKVWINIFFDYVRKAKNGVLQGEDAARIEDMEIVVSGYIKQMEKQSKKASTINHYIGALNRLLDYAKVKEVDVYEEVPEGEEEELYKVARVKEDLNVTLADDRVMENEDYLKLMEAAIGDKRALAIFSFLYDSGARISEALQIRIEDFTVDKRGLEATIQRKGGGTRELDFSNHSIKYLEDYLNSTTRSLDSTGPIFTNKRTGEGLVDKTIHKIIKKYAGLTGLPTSKFFCHSFRKSYARTLYNNGKGLDINELQGALGHKRPSTTQLYLRKSRSDTRERKREQKRKNWIETITKKYIGDKERVEIIKLLADNPKITQKALGEKLGVASSTFNRKYAGFVKEIKNDLDL
ncbi:MULTISPECIES: tyrosine-type recombinase/integrase [Psychrilyobacter]|nr:MULTISPECIES: tyrosine-type recombinase/integrase [Psychrilyobacter]MCS5422198.1 tyrosine-type recombinase/integrase [Psychrilyobacter sp. S5]NDI77155.1 tyrosine-type recombinase/integrase [Psychrilyobacter piezotolerans]